jgi:hypothetical protein
VHATWIIAMLLSASLASDSLFSARHRVILLSPSRGSQGALSTVLNVKPRVLLVAYEALLTLAAIIAVT